MKNIKLGFALLALLFIGCKEKVVPGNKEQSTSPNIVLFFVDDMGWQDTSVPFWTQRTAYPKYGASGPGRDEVYPGLRYCCLFTHTSKSYDGYECGAP